MKQENQRHNIYTKEYISEKDYYEIKQLQDLCFDQDKINLKLELEYKLFISNNAKLDTKEQSDALSTNHLNEFLYYIDNTLIAYIGISCFGGNEGEINGMTHPDWRKKGIFHKLFDLVAMECERRDYSKILLLSDDNSESGTAFIKSVGGIYNTSEYRMKRLGNSTLYDSSSITLRIAQKQDKKKIAELNTILYHDKEEIIEDTENDVEINAPNIAVFLIELAEKVIGKIHVEYGSNSAFIFGFGIIPDYRKKGYGKAALNETLRLIESKNITDIGLDVVCTNKNALNLYINSGFEQQSIMNYYEYLTLKAEK